MSLLARLSRVSDKGRDRRFVVMPRQASQLLASRKQKALPPTVAFAGIARR